MTTTFDGKAFQAEVRRLDGLLREGARFADPAVQAHARALLQAVLALHGAGLERIVAHMEEAGDAGRAVLNACADDEVAAGLLLLHGLHPHDLDARVRQAVERTGVALRSRGGEVELIGVSDGVVRLRLSRADDGRGATAAAMRRSSRNGFTAWPPRSRPWRSRAGRGRWRKTDEFWCRCPCCERGGKERATWPTIA